jgi:hypothetical protein
MSDRSKQPIAIADLEAAEKELRKRLNTLKMLRAAMKDAKVPEIMASGSKSLPRAYGFLDTFIGSCRKELGEP